MEQEQTLLMFSIQRTVTVLLLFRALSGLFVQG